MNAEILAVGSEMLTPSKVDTNSLFLTAQLNELGVEVLGKAIIADRLDLLTDAVRAALQRVELVILSGGLGPTEDDLTRNAVAAALGRELDYHDDIFQAIVERFKRFGRRLTENNRRQAEVIHGAHVLANPHGTAPGQWLEVDGRIVVLLPGPPRELEPMWLDQCRHRLAAKLPPAVIRTLYWRICGMGESQVDALVAPIYTQYQNPVTTILSSLGDISLHLRARAETAAVAESLLAEVGARMEPLLGQHLYSKEGEALETVIGHRLRQRGQSLATAESLTGGLIASRLTEIPGSSEYYLGGFVTYSDPHKVALGVDAALIQAHGAVSEPVALAMAAAARTQAGTDWALSSTGFAGPGGGTEKDPIGTVYLGLSGPDQLARVERFRFIGDRERVRLFSTQYGLDVLRRALSA